jgi:hypothetical protein
MHRTSRGPTCGMDRHVALRHVAVRVATRGGAARRLQLVVGRLHAAGWTAPQGWLYADCSKLFACTLHVAGRAQVQRMLHVCGPCALKRAHIGSPADWTSLGSSPCAAHARTHARTQVRTHACQSCALTRSEAVPARRAALATRNGQRTHATHTCSMQHATQQHATCTTACNIQHNMQHGMHHATCSMRHATCSMRHATQHATCIAHRSTRSGPNLQRGSQLRLAWNAGRQQCRLGCATYRACVLGWRGALRGRHSIPSRKSGMESTSPTCTFRPPTRCSLRTAYAYAALQ